MSIQEIADKLQSMLNSEMKPGLFTVGVGDNTIFIYEHVRGYAKLRSRPEWIPKEIKVVYKYVGKIKPL